MHQTTYGYNIFDSGDPAKGSSGWFNGINANSTRLDAHSHNGTDSVKLTPLSVTAFSGSILAANWITSDRSDGGYMQTVTAPVGIDDVNNYVLILQFTAPGGLVGQRMVPDWVRLTATTFKVYSNDNTAAFTMIFR